MRYRGALFGLGGVILGGALGYLVGGRHESLAAPKDHRRLVAAGDASYDAGDNRRAVEAYQAALSLKPDDPYVLTNLGVCLQALGESERALGLFETALRIDPGYWKALFNEVVVYGNRRDYPRALSSLERLKALRAAHADIPPLDDLETHLRLRAAGPPR